MTITSPHNERLKEIRKLTRRRAREATGRFAAEGEDLLAAAHAAGWVAVERYCAAGSGLGGVEVSAELLASVSGLGSGTRALAVYEERWSPQPLGPLCVYLHGLADPSNVGAVLRSAEAFGASCVALGPGCADPFGPRAVRASMGAVFGVPLARLKAAGESRLPGTTVALVARGGVPLSELTSVSTTPRGSETSVRPHCVTIMVGSERHGLPDELVANADHVARIPIVSDSINAAMATTIALYELTRRMARA